MCTVVLTIVLVISVQNNMNRMHAILEIIKERNRYINRKGVQACTRLTVQDKNLPVLTGLDESGEP